jgi:hypothetical protein
VQLIHIDFKQGSADSLEVKVSKVVEIHSNDSTSSLPDDKLQLETLYFVASWLLFAARERMVGSAQGSPMRIFLTRLKGPTCAVKSF